MISLFPSDPEHKKQALEGVYLNKVRNNTHKFMQKGIMYMYKGKVASWLVCSTPDLVVQVQALTGDIVLCSWARHFTLTVPLSTQVYRWVLANYNAGG